VSLLGYPYEENDYLMFRISADRFLRNMVRAVVGSLLEVGRGKKDPQWINELIEGGNRSDAGESVPGNALFLNKIQY
jgi:tRNA pseudouridine38-40 synthase